MSGNRIEYATVLSDDMVMADAYENGWRWRSMMKFSDWLLISGHVTVITDTPLVSLTDVAVQEAEAAAASAPAPVPLPKRPVGTKLRWVLGEETYRIAIATTDGILQVKSVTDGAGECLPLPADAYSWQTARLKKTLFITEEEWRSSLPQGGEVTIVELLPKNAPVIVEGASDVEKIEQLAIRFKVRAGVYEERSPLARREDMANSITKYTRIIANSEALQWRTEDEAKICQSFKRYVEFYKKGVQAIDAMSEAEKSKREFMVARYAQSKQKLCVTLANGISTQISPSSKIETQEGSEPLPRAIFCHHDRKLYSSLDEMNVFKGANGPVIQASYRMKMIDLSHLFSPQVAQA
jgi:hypothetical protein